MNWRDELTWMAIALGSGIALALVYLYFGRFPDASGIVVMLVCSLGFYMLSILVRIQNRRGRILTGKTVVAEHRLKYVVPVVGFGIGLALLLFG